MSRHYKLDLLAHKVRTQRIMSMDMGTANTALTLLVVKRQGRDIIKSIKVFRCMMVTDLISDLTEKGLPLQSAAFKAFIEMQIAAFQPHEITCERFLSRGLLGALGEKVSVMIGMTLDISLERKIPCVPITAASWKNAFQRLYGKGSLDQLYAQSRKHTHLIDSMLMACYQARVFEALADKKVLQGLLDQVFQAEIPKRPSKPRRKKRASAPRAKSRTTARAPSKRARRT